MDGAGFGERGEGWDEGPGLARMFPLTPLFSGVFAAGRRPVSSADAHPTAPSFPRKRESILIFATKAQWIPAFAGMTAVGVLCV